MGNNLVLLYANRNELTTDKLYRRLTFDKFCYFFALSALIVV